MNRKTGIGKTVFAFLSVLFWLIVWAAAALAISNELLLPSPAAVFMKLISFFGSSVFYISVLNSVLRIMAGFAAGIICGIILAVLSDITYVADRLFAPLILVIKTTPVASFIILALVWIKTNNIPGFIAFLMVVPIVYANISEGLKNIDSVLKDVCTAYDFSIWKRIKLLYIPSLTPYFLSAFCTALGFSWKAGVAAEVLARPKNTIGASLYDSKIYLETIDLFAYTAIVIIISLIIEKLLVWIIKNISRKYFGRLGKKENGK